MAYKPVNADDKPKLILISCLAVGVFTFGIVRIATGGGQRAHAAKPTEINATGKVDPSETVNELSDAELLEAAEPNPSAGRDPFIADAALRSATPSAPQPHPGTDNPTSTALPSTNKRPIGVETLTWNPPPVQPSPEKTPPLRSTTIRDAPKVPQTTPLPELPACTLKGTLVDGENPVAILESSGERRFLHIGDAVADRFYVKAIRLDGITVAHRTTSTLLIRLRNGKPYQPQSGSAEQTK